MEFFQSGKPGSNRPPRPWQGRALPNELLPHISISKLLLLVLLRPIFYRDCKNKRYSFPTKIFYELFVLRGVQCVARHVHLGFALVTMRVQAIATTQSNGQNAKYLQIKKEYRRIHPIISKVFCFGVFYFFCCFHN